METTLFKGAMNLVKADKVNELMDLVKGQDSYSVSLLLCYAAEVNAENTLRFLLSSKDVMPGMCDNFALRIASAKGNTKSVELLLADSRVDASVLERVTEKKENMKSFEPVETEAKVDDSIVSQENDIEVNEEIEDIESQESQVEDDLELPEVEDDLDFLDIPEEEKIESFDEINKEIEKIETEDLDVDYEEDEEMFKEIDKNVKKGWDAYVSVSKEEVDKLHENGKVWVPEFLKKSNNTDSQ